MNLAAQETPAISHREYLEGEWFRVRPYVLHLQIHFTCMAGNCKT